MNDIARKEIDKKEIVKKEEINKGWSEDKKYLATATDGEKFLLRTSSVEQYTAKQLEFQMMQKLQALGVPMCEPIEFGTNEEGVYSLQSWISGYDAEEIIPMLSKEDQYSYGFEAGEILSRIHSIPAPNNQDDWTTRFNRKIDRKIKSYQDCPIKYENGQPFLDYINENRKLLYNRPQSYQHGDYHIGNMMVNDEGKLIIIDFNRNDYGDPWEEFNRIVWCAQASHEFASGMVDGYFEKAVPMEFWRLLAVYIASNTMSSLPWAIPFGQDEINTMKQQANEVLIWYDNMKNPVPSWYQTAKFTTKNCIETAEAAGKRIIFGKRVVEKALMYANYEWYATEKNRMHGMDTAGRYVDTPDVTWRGETLSCGWWKTNELNIGIPYGWGNASSLEEFEQGLVEGKYAGNVPEDTTRYGSHSSVGVDCSGLLTVCWNLPKKIAAKNIPEIAVVVENLSDIKQGDVFAIRSHVMLFKEFVDDSKEEVIIIDATRSTGKVSQRKLRVSELFAKGYQIYRKEI